VVASNSPAKDLLQEIETEVIKAIQQGLAKETGQ